MSYGHIMIFYHTLRAVFPVEWHGRIVNTQGSFLTGNPCLDLSVSLSKSHHHVNKLTLLCLPSQSCGRSLLCSTFKFHHKWRPPLSLHAHAHANANIPAHTHIHTLCLHTEEQHRGDTVSPALFIALCLSSLLQTLFCGDTQTRCSRKKENCFAFNN